MSTNPRITFSYDSETREFTVESEGVAFPFAGLDMDFESMTYDHDQRTGKLTIKMRTAPAPRPLKVEPVRLIVEADTTAAARAIGEAIRKYESAQGETSDGSSETS